MIFRAVAYLTARKGKTIALVFLSLLPIWYSGFAGASAPLGIEVVSSLNPSVTGQDVTLTAILHGDVYDGTVTFRNGATVLATVPVVGAPPFCNPIPGGTCLSDWITRVSFTSPFTTSLDITATYSGNASHAPSTSRAYYQRVSPSIAPASFSSLVTATNSAVVFLAFSGGGPSCRFQRADAISLRGVDMTPSDYSRIASQYAFPHGLFDFVTTNCAPGTTLNFSLTFYFLCPAGAICPAAFLPINVATNSVYWKYGPTASNPTPHWYQLPAVIGSSFTGFSNTISFAITDGGLGDDDLTANGIIVDQGGPGVPIVATPIPSTSKSALFALTGILLFAGLMIIRHRRIFLFRH